jgi:hypothetical protein
MAHLCFSFLSVSAAVETKAQLFRLQEALHDKRPLADFGNYSGNGNPMQN